MAPPYSIGFICKKCFTYAALRRSIINIGRTILHSPACKSNISFLYHIQLSRSSGRCSYCSVCSQMLRLQHLFQQETSEDVISQRCVQYHHSFWCQYRLDTFSSYIILPGHRCVQNVDHNVPVTAFTPILVGQVFCYTLLYLFHLKYTGTRKL